jgi:hypothetical protein
MIGHEHRAVDITLRDGLHSKLELHDVDSKRVNSVLLRVGEGNFSLTWFDGIQWKTGYTPILVPNSNMIILLWVENDQWHGDLKVVSPYGTPKEAEVIKSVVVAPRPDPVLEVEVRGNYPHIGKSRVMELIKRTLEKHGYTGVQVVKQDADQQFWDARHDDELRAVDSLTTMNITLIDNNQKPVGVNA